MMNSGSSSNERAFDWINEPEEGWDSWINELHAEEFPEFLVNSGVDAATVNPNYPNQPIMSTRNSSTGVIGGAANMSQHGTPQNKMAVSSFTPTNSTAAVLSRSGHILPPIPTFASNTVSQSSQSSGTADLPKYQVVQTTQAHQNQPLLQQAFKHKAVQQQPLTHSSANQSSVITVNDQKNQLMHYQMPYQMPSDQLVRCTSPMLNTQTTKLQNNQASGLQNQQSSNQNPLQFQQGTLNNSIPEGHQLGNNLNIELTVPVGFSTPSEFPSSDAWREYVIRQIFQMKERYLNELLTMHNEVMRLRIKATDMNSVLKYDNVRNHLERMMTFLHISRVDYLPKNDERVYNFLNFIVNYVKYRKSNKSTAGSSQHREAVHQPPAMQPSGTMKLQYNPPPNPPQGVANLEANMVNFNQNFTSRRPQQQPQQARTTGSLNNASFQMGIEQKPANPLQTDLFKASQPSVMNTTTQQTSLGPKPRSYNRSGRSPISLFTNTTATNFPSRPLNYQPPSANQKLNSEKLKQPMHITSDLTKSKTGQGVSPWGPILLNHSSSPQFSLPSTVKPVSQSTSVSSSRFDVNYVLSPQSIALSPFLLSSASCQTTPEKQSSSGLSSLPIEETQKLKTPMDSPSQEQQNSKDAVHRLMEVLKAVSSKTIGSSFTEIDSIYKQKDSIPPYVPSNPIGPYTQDEVNKMVQKDTKPQPKMSRELSVSLVHHDQCAFEECDTYPTEISINKRPKTENTHIILEEIKEINRKLLETSANVVLEPSEENIKIPGDYQGTIVKCLFKNVCFPDLRGPQGGVASEKMPEFVILLLVPVDYPASSPTILNYRRNDFTEPWEKLYKETLSRYDVALRAVPGKMSLGDMVRKWDANARAVITKFVEEKGGKSFSSRYGGGWNKC